MRFDQHAFAIDPFNVRVRNSLEVLEVLSGYATLETDHFIIKFDRGHDEVLALVDSTQAGTTSQDLLGVGDGIPVVARLDCTGGWWSEQSWDAVPLRSLACSVSGKERARRTRTSPNGSSCC